MDAEGVRKLALGLPDATEAPHFHFTSFRIGGRIFATMPPGSDLLHIFVPDEDREVAVAAHPGTCEALHWGKRTVGLRVDLTRAGDELIEDLIRAAYEAKAQARR